jgi:hypothetical protein
VLRWLIDESVANGCFSSTKTEVAVDIVMRVALLYRLCSVAVAAFGAGAGAGAKLWLLTGGRCALSFSLLSLVLQ